MTQPVHIFSPDGYAATSTIRSSKLNPGGIAWQLTDALGPSSAFVPIQADSLDIFANNFPDWLAFTEAQLAIEAFSLWLDPVSSAYILARSDLVATAPPDETDPEASGSDFVSDGSGHDKKPKAVKAKAAEKESANHGKGHDKRSWSKADIRHEDEPEDDDKPRSRR